MVKKTPVQIGITALALGLAAAHMIWPGLKVDGTTAAFLLIAVIPWLSPLFKSIKIPGGVEIQYQDLERAEAAANRAGLQKDSVTASSPTYPFQNVADSNLALAGVRLEIEKRLRLLAEREGMDGGSRPLRQLMRLLQERQALQPAEVAALDDMIGILNSAAHGAQIEAETRTWAMDLGLRLLASLERKLEDTS